MIIATHSGKFHADDVWAVVVLDLLFPGCELIRTRDLEKIRRADFAVDVGGIWDPATGRFDHHQKGFAGARQSGVVYASAGLVWREHGARCVQQIAQQTCGHVLGHREAQEMAYAIDNDVVQYLDMADTGAARNAPGGYGLSAIVSGFNPTWLDEEAVASTSADRPASNSADRLLAMENMRLQRFRRAMEVVADVLVNQVRYRVGSMLALEQVRNAERLEDGRLLLLKNAALPWAAVVRHEMPKVVFVLSYSSSEQRYLLHTIPKSTESFEARKDLPAAWAGLQGPELAEATGVPDAVFCHNNLFIAAAVSFEGALRMARLALAA